MAGEIVCKDPKRVQNKNTNRVAGNHTKKKVVVHVKKKYPLKEIRLKKRSVKKIGGVSDHRRTTWKPWPSSRWTNRQLPCPHCFETWTKRANGRRWQLF
jgi:hypothetical protein